MIYFIQGAGSLIKIGTTVNLTQRLQQLCDEAKGDLKVLAVVDGGRDEECALHKRFSHLRTFGEWFEPGVDLVRFIALEGRKWDGTDEATVVTILAYKGTPAFADWLKGLAGHAGLPLTNTLDQALRSYAEKIGYDKPAPRRQMK